MIQGMLAIGIAALVAGCGMAKSTPGEDPRTESNATTVTWTDGKPAIAISCKEPRGRHVQQHRRQLYGAEDGKHADTRRHDHGARRGLGRHSLRRIAQT
jgi:hypothetical protein